MDQTTREKKSVAEVFQQFWTQALSTVTGAEEEATKLLGKIQGLAGWTPEEARKQVREFSERLASQRKDVEQRMEDSIAQALGKMRVPRREEIVQLNARLDGLNKRLEALSK